MNKIELLAPAGDLEKLKYAVVYGADAVYIGGEIFGMRVSAKNFAVEQMAAGIDFAHARGVKVYLTLNIIPHNDDIDLLYDYLQSIKHLAFDAYIISDPGVLSVVQEVNPTIEVHLSTQANNTNYKSAAFWHKFGISRVILARELSLAEIVEIRQKTPQSLQLEAFVHGSMCISYSGRCLISNYMTGRDANQGACSHPCRWKYHLVEEKRPGEYYPIEQTEQGTYFFNSKDLCMIEQIPDLIAAGLSSLKIEGRSKSIYYVANVVRAYRKAIDDYYRDPQNYQFDKALIDEIKKASHREFTSGFYNQKADDKSQLYDNSAYIRDYDFIGVVKSYDPDSGLAAVEQRNRIFKGDTIEVMGSGYRGFEQKIDVMLDKAEQSIDVAPHAQQLIYIKMSAPVEPYDILRRARD